MRVRHLVARDNVDADSQIIDATVVHHGLIVGRRIEALAGRIDPSTHLNLDYAEHVLAAAIVVEKLAVGSPVLLDINAVSFAVAGVARTAYAHLGRVDMGARRLAWQRSFVAENVIH